MSKPVGVGILGFAHGHVNMYCQQWRARPELGVAVVAGWDHDAARLAKAAADQGFAPAETVAQVLERSDVDAVVIAAETSHHAALVEQAAAAGKAIVLQKPIALTLPEADRIVAAVESTGVPFTLAWQMRVDPQNLLMREWVLSGDLGRLFTVRRRHGLTTHTWAGFEDLWHNKPAYNRDIWADDAAHPIDFVRWLLGMPATVMAELRTLMNPRVPNDNGVAIFGYPDGTLAEVVCSFTAVAGENTTEVLAERGVIVQNYGDGPTCSVPRPDGAPGLKRYLDAEKQWTASDIPSPRSQGERIAALAGPLAEFLHGRRPAIASAADGRESLRMVLATYLSSREGCRIRLDDPRIASI